MKTAQLDGFRAASGHGFVAVSRAAMEGGGRSYVLTFTAADGAEQKIMLSIRGAWLVATLLIRCFDKDRREGSFQL